MKIHHSLFENIKKARIASGLSQKDLAYKLGVSDKTISAYETGRAIPPTPTLSKIAKITNIQVSDILGESNDSNNNKVLEKLDHLEERLSHIEKVLIKLIGQK